MSSMASPGLVIHRTPKSGCATSMVGKSAVGRAAGTFGVPTGTFGVPAGTFGVPAGTFGPSAGTRRRRQTGFRAIVRWTMKGVAMHVLVAYGSKMGGTAGIAEMLAGDLVADGVQRTSARRVRAEPRRL